MGNGIKGSDSRSATENKAQSLNGKMFSEAKTGGPLFCYEIPQLIFRRRNVMSKQGKRKEEISKKTK